MIPHNKPLFDEADQLAITKALKSGYVAQGSEVTHLEQELSDYIGAHKSILVNSGTTAIYLALYSLNVHKDDEVILPTYVCSALLNAIFMIGAKPCLVDVNEEDFNINWDMVACNVTNRTKAIIVPHIHGMPSFIPGNSFMGCPIIEDCATALGSYISIGDSLIHVGGKTDVSIFSFYATKFCTMGYGGFISTNDDMIAEKIVSYREFDCVDEYKPRFNFQVSDINAALGRSQIRKVEQFLRRRELIRKLYDDVFDSKGIQRQNPLIPCKYNKIGFVSPARRYEAPTVVRPPQM